MWLSGRETHLEFQSGIMSSSGRKLQQSPRTTDTFLSYNLVTTQSINWRLIEMFHIVEQSWSNQV